MRELKKITIGQLFDERVRLSPTALFISDDTTSLSWKEADKLVHSQAAYYLRAGMVKGERAAICGLNCTEWIITYLALAKLGVIAVLINAALKTNELHILMKENNINYFIYGKGRKNYLCTAAEDLKKADLPCMKKIFSMFDEVHRAAKLNCCDMENLRSLTSKLNCDDIISILFTSGTSGRAKGVMLTHYNIVNTALGVAEQMQWREDDVMCTAVPLFHCFGLTIGIIGALCTGASLILLPYFSSTAVLRAIEQYRCTVFNGVPTFFLALANNKRFSDFDISSLKSGIIAGSPIIPSEYIKIYKTLKIQHLQTSFGLTESSPSVTLTRWEDSLEIKANTSGILLEHIELQILDINKLQPAAPGKEGEILTRGYQVMKGYYNMPEETQAAIDSNGWLHTGDYGFLDDQGYLHVTGRIKDIIMRGGEIIAPAEIENVLMMIPEIAAVKVIGIKADILQETVAACLIWKNEKTLSLREIQDFTRQYLADFKVPEAFYTFQKFPTNASGKILTGRLREIIGEMSKKGK